MAETREQIAQKMAEQLKASGACYMNEVAMPGCRPDNVKDEDIAKFPEDVNKIQ